MLLSDTEIASYYIIFSTGPCRRDGLVVGERDCQSSAHGSNPTEAVSKLFSISFTPLDFASVFSEETLPFMRCAIIGNVQVNWPKLFLDFSVNFTLICSYMRSFNPNRCS